MSNAKRHCGFLGGVLAFAVAGVLGLDCATALAAEKPSEPLDAFAQNKRLGRGVNILSADPLWRSRSRARMQDKHFKLIREAGFSNVRIVLSPFRAGKPDQNHTLSLAWFETLEWAVKLALDNHLMPILDVHEYTAMGRNPEKYRGQFLATWKQIAERYQDSPDEVFFEILNEPNSKLTPEVWNRLLSDALAIIRQSNPNRTVIIGPAFWNSIGYLDKLELPENDRKLIITVHYYSPMEFTHQGASWTSQRYKVGVEWKGTDPEKQAIVRDFDKAQAWAQKHNRPLFLGEFGAYDRGDMPSRVRWTSFVVRQAEKLGWSWAYWQFDSDFIVYDMRNDKWVEPIRDGLIPSSR